MSARFLLRRDQKGRIEFEFDFSGWPAVLLAAFVILSALLVSQGYYGG